MKKKVEKYLVGIDLGTTHTVVAYTEVGTAKADQIIQIFEINQLISPGEVLSRPLLPSVRYHPAEGELSDEDFTFSPAGDDVIIGEAARLLGAKTQGRLVTSAKSWLSHSSVDPTADILPWGGADDVLKVSPLDASASYLSHIRTVWKHQFPDAPLEKQTVVITVPASFDDVARALTVEAAKKAGLKDILLLEEPQAVCYDWLHRNTKQLKQLLENIRLLLICDVGGGTTDLTLIKVEQGADEPKLTRIGVGDHLMLGGDNIDLALAHLAESRMVKNGKKLSSAELAQLLEQCRIAKERLLTEDAPESVQVTLLGGGSKLIGSSRTTQLEKQEVRQIVLNGFFPLSGVNDLPDRKRSGVVEFGLPYASEPAISKHIAAFLKLHQQASSSALESQSYVPDAVLLNGGVFRSQAIVNRTIELISSWREQQPILLENSQPNLSVAFGAVNYAIARRDKKLQIGGGSARSYFVLVETHDENSHFQTESSGLCILPQGSEEGVEIILKEQQFSLRIGQPVRFHLASTIGDRKYHSGDLVEITDEHFHFLPPLAVAFEGEDNDEVLVKLAVTLTEVGTLKLQCVSISENKQRFDVEFQIRAKGGGNLQLREELPNNFNDAINKIQQVYGSKLKKIESSAVKTLRADLEKIIGLSRSEWEPPLLRELFSVLLEGLKTRRRTENHERIWLSLIGFCLRPGFGYPLDDWRVDQLWKIYNQTIQFVNERQNWTEWWTLWRRIAGGLSVERQEQLYKDISKYINPAAARQAGVAKQVKVRGYDDMVRLSGVLERLPVDKKILLCEWLLKRLVKSSEPKQTWWAVGRIASRVPFYGSEHNVIPANTVIVWMQQLFKLDWKKIPQAGFAATLMCRMSGDRARDIEDTVRHQVVEKLKISKAPLSWIAMVESYTELSEIEEKQVFGEALPPGLKLISN